ncbi:MAG: hypothetical protein Q7K40_03375 [bacterium]|nr:hypothetical protein [bacterium]
MNKTKVISIKGIGRLLMGSIIVGLVLPAGFSSASISDWQKGATVYPNWNTEFAGEPFKQSLKNLADTHANYVTLVIPLYQSSADSTDIQSGWNTPTDESLISAITYAHNLGLRVVLKPHVDLYSGEWRAYANPTDRNQWFSNYTTYIMNYVDLAAKYNIEDFVIGSELISLSSDSFNSTNTQNWRNLVAKVRTTYTGKLTYSANWGPTGFTDEKNNIQFWDSLDYIGISAYFNLDGDGSITSLKSLWENINNADISPLSQRFGKQIVFTEVGYRSVTGSYREPWNYSLNGASDEQGQANAYQALFEYWNTQSFMEGVQLWHWMGDPNAGGSGATDYTPQNKLAQGTITTWFNTNTLPPPTIAPPQFVISTQPNPNNINVGGKTSINTQITNDGGATGNTVVDIEIYNSLNQKIFQKYYDMQGFPQGQSRSYLTDWSPTAEDTYSIKIGVFNYNWSERYIWVNNAGNIVVGNQTPPPTTSSQIDIWWPTQSANIGGPSVPFKGVLRGVDVSMYTMLWQVDGGGLVNMPTNLTDYPHKQFDTDLTGWTWKGSGPYRINFIARDKNDVTLTEKSVDVTIWR